MQKNKIKNAEKNIIGKKKILHVLRMTTPLIIDYKILYLMFGT